MLLTTFIFLMALGGVVRVNVEGAWVCPPLAVQALKVHNELRAHHGAPPLTLDADMVKIAEKCAVYYAQKRAIDHTCPYKNGAADNLTGGPGVWSALYMATENPKSWYSEVSQYNYNNPGFSMKTGHFTQVVWKSSVKFGYGYTTINGFTVGVGLYFPHGNVEGLFPANVLPRIQ